MVSYTIPGMKKASADKVVALLQDRLDSLSDLALTLKHVHWNAIEATEELDPVTQDMLIGHSGQLEQFHWFVRAHLENSDGTLRTERASTERSAARRAAG